MVKTVTLRKMNNDEYMQWKEWSISDYAKSLIESGKYSENTAKSQAEAEFSSSLKNGLSTPNHHIFIAENVDGVPVGMIWYETEDPKHAFIADFVIYDQYRQMGYGYATLVEMENILRSTGVLSVELHVFEHNKTAITLYEKCGYSIMNDYTGDGSLYMKKQF